MARVTIRALSNSIGYSCNGILSKDHSQSSGTLKIFISSAGCHMPDLSAVHFFVHIDATSEIKLKYRKIRYSSLVNLFVGSTQIPIEWGRLYVKRLVPSSIPKFKGKKKNQNNMQSGSSSLLSFCSE